MRILVAEDEVATRTMLRGVLEGQGHEVTVACDGSEAWRVLVEPASPKMIILDWMMPKISGIELCRRLRERETERRAHVIMLTAFGDRQHIVEGLDAGASDYVVKPFDCTELRARIAAGERDLLLQDKLAAKAEELRLALRQIRSLQSIIPICMHCKRVRDDKNYWETVESYITSHTGALVSHGLCPECLEKHYPEFSND